MSLLHPHHLHARAALWSLVASYRHLQAALRAAEAAAAEDADRGTLRAWRPAVGRSSGHSDALAVAIATPPTQAALTHYERLAERARNAMDQAYWLATSDLGHPVTEHTQLAAVLPDVAPRTARDIHGWLADADHAIRRALGLLPDHWPLPTSPECPACGVRMLRVQTSAPDSAQWTVVCTAGCHCTGDGCPCGMTVRERGVPHIWDRNSQLVAQELARIPYRGNRSRDAAERHQHAE